MPQKVLVVTDDAQVRDEMTYAFPSDVEVVTVDDARQAAAWMKEQIPSVVVMDLQMGNAGGFSLAKEMAEFGRLAGVPVYLLLEREQDAWLARQAGAAGSAVKPVEAGTLAAAALSLAN